MPSRADTWGRLARERVPVDLEDRGDEFVLVADLPGRTVQDIDVTVRPESVVLTADAPGEEPGTYRHRERPDGTVEREVALPERVDAERARATYRNGVLEVHLKKADGRRVDVA